MLCQVTTRFEPDLIGLASDNTEAALVGTVPRAIPASCSSCRCRCPRNLPSRQSASVLLQPCVGDDGGGRLKFIRPHVHPCRPPCADSHPGRVPSSALALSPALMQGELGLEAQVPGRLVHEQWIVDNVARAMVGQRAGA